MPVINGTSGNDSLTGGDADDTINGFAGQDTLIGNGGADLIDASDGNDSLYGGSGSDTLFGGNNSDRLFGGTDNDLLDGGSGNDSLYGEAGNDTLRGGTGNDTLDGGSDIDTLSYSTSTNAVNVNIQTNTVSGGDAQNDSISNFENVVGSGANDSLTGSTVGNMLDGGAGNDTLTGAAGNDSLFGGAGTDQLYGGNDDDWLEGGASGDTISGGAGIDTASYASSTSGVSANLQTLSGTAGDAAGDTFSSIENLNGSALNDTLVGDFNANTLTGGDGNDILDGNNGNDSLLGGDGADTLSGGSGNDTLDGGDGADRIYAGAGNDSVAAGSGDDVVYGDPTGTSAWTYRFYDKDFSSNSSQAFTIEEGTLRLEGTTADFNLRNLAATARGTTPDVNPEDFGIILTSTYTAATAGTYRFTTTSDDGSVMRILDAAGNPLNFANQTGGTLPYLNNDFHQAATTRYGDVVLAAGQTYTIEIRIWENLGEEVLAATVTVPGGTSQNLIGNNAIGAVAANAGNDTLSGGIGNDTIYGEAGNDSLLGDEGNDQLFGGTGNDTLSGGADADSLDGGAGNDQLFGGDGVDTLYGGADNDALYGDAGADNLFGDAGTDSLFGGSENDTLFGGASNDTLSGDGGDDSLSGDAGADQLFGGAGNDFLSGGTENDSLEGGADNDTLFGGDGLDTLRGGSGADSLSGDAGGDSLFGEAGDDSLTGGAAADFMSGGDDRDTFFVSVGTDGYGDTVDGGETGDDTADTLNLVGAGEFRIDYDANPEDGTVSFLDATRTNVLGTLRFTGIETVVPCFTPGTRIATQRGDVPVEALLPGDLVQTRDSGMQPLRWIGRRTLGASELDAAPTLAPVRIAAGALGPGLPARDLTVSPQHRVLVSGALPELLFGDDEVLVAAVHLVGCPGIDWLDVDEVTYLHLLFDRHEIVLSDGLWSESFQPGDRTLAGMDAAQRAEIGALFPTLDAVIDFASARRSLKAHEARVLFAA